MNAPAAPQAQPAPPTFRFTGHDTFQCRYAWLPKAVKFVECKDGNPFAQEDEAMVSLGVGKNMVRSIAFWAEVSGVIENQNGKLVSSEFGKLLLGHEGHDEFLQNIQTLWLL